MSDSEVVRAREDALIEIRGQRKALEAARRANVRKLEKSLKRFARVVDRAQKRLGSWALRADKKLEEIESLVQGATWRSADSLEGEAVVHSERREETFSELAARIQADIEDQVWLPDEMVSGVDDALDLSDFASELLREHDEREGQAFLWPWSASP